LLAQASGPLQAIAHDLHPDFYSTQLATALAQRLGIPAIAVQHHHAHVGAVLAEQGIGHPVIALTLDGFGLGTDGNAWGGEVLWVDGADHGHVFQRVGHLATLAQPGGDAAAREPWRVAAAVLFATATGAMKLNPCLHHLSVQPPQKPSTPCCARPELPALQQCRALV
jgi:hydrogenase maturation protein HypF